MTTEEDLYGSSSGPCNAPISCVPAVPLPRGHWAPPDMIYRFWQCTLRPLRNEGCNALEIGKDIYHMASVTAKDYETCTVAPHPDLTMSHVLVHGEDGFYEFTPRRPLSEKLASQPVSLVIGLGERPVAAHESRVPEEFNPLLPFHINQTHDFFYICQGLTTRVIPRVGWEGRFRKYLTLSFSGLIFNVKYTETTKVEIVMTDSLK